MRITTFSNNVMFGGVNRSAQGKQGVNIVADMVQNLRESAQRDLQAAAEKQAAVSKKDRVELAVKGSAQYAAEVYRALTGTDNKLANEKQLAAQAAKAMQEALEKQKEAAKDEAEATKEAMEYMLKMLEIARRISNGGEVPSLDEMKLLEYSQVLYTMAKTMAMMADEHEKYDSLFEDEEAAAEGGAKMSGGEAAMDAGGGEIAAAAPAAPAADVAVE